MTRHHDINSTLPQSFDKIRRNCFFHHTKSVKCYLSDHILLFPNFSDLLSRGLHCSLRRCIRDDVQTIFKTKCVLFDQLLCSQGAAIRQTTPRPMHIADRYNQFGSTQSVSHQNRQNALKLYDNFLTKSLCDLRHQTRTVRRRIYLEKISSLYSVENTDFDSGVITS